MILTHGANSLKVGGSPLPPGITLYDNLTLSTSFVGFPHAAQIQVPTNGIVNTDKTVVIDFTFRDIVYQDNWFVYGNGNSSSSTFSMRVVRPYTNYIAGGFSNGKTQENYDYSGFGGTSRIGVRQLWGIRNNQLKDLNTNTVLLSGSNYQAGLTIGTLYFGYQLVTSNCLTYHRFTIKTDSDEVLMDLVPAKHESTIGFYDMVSSQFYGAGNSSYWTVSNNVRMGDIVYPFIEIN